MRSHTQKKEKKKGGGTPTHFLGVIRPDVLTLIHTLLMLGPPLPWTAQSPGRDVRWSDTLGRTWMLPEMVSDAFLARAKIGACHRPSPPPPPPPLAVLFALSPDPDFSSCSLKIPNTWPFSLLLSASDRTRSWSAGDAILTYVALKTRVVAAIRRWFIRLAKC